MRLALRPAHFLPHTSVSRPAQWSKSSVIYTAHESEPQVLGRHFPSAQQFYLPNPPLPYPIEADPPTVLSLCPSDDWLFAYFPGKSGEGFGCIWHKEAQLDDWQVKECWTYPVGGGIVTAAWSYPHREVRYTLHSFCLKSKHGHSGSLRTRERRCAFLLWVLWPRLGLHCYC